MYLCHVWSLYFLPYISNGILPKTHGLSFFANTGELGYDGPLYDGCLHMTDDMLGPSPMHIKYSSYVYDGFCI